MFCVLLRRNLKRKKNKKISGLRFIVVESDGHVDTYPIVVAFQMNGFLQKCTGITNIEVCLLLMYFGGEWAIL